MIEFGQGTITFAQPITDEDIIKLVSVYNDIARARVLVVGEEEMTLSNFVRTQLLPKQQVWIKCITDQILDELKAYTCKIHISG